MNEARSEHSGRPRRRVDRDAPRRGDREVSRRGDRDNVNRRSGATGPPDGGGERTQHSGGRDNTSFGERRGRKYDGSRRGARPGLPGSQRAGERREAHAGDGPREQGRPGQEVRQNRRVDEPSLPESIEAADLDPEVRRDLRTLDKGNAETVARHLVAAMHLVDDEPGLALAHGRAAKGRAGRIGVVRETLGVLAYRAGEWAEALGELRAARRISGGPGLLAMMADCERGLERPEKAIELARGDESRRVTDEDLVELRIVEAGARVDMGQLDAALVTLQDAGLDAAARGDSAARLDYAYAETLLAADRKREAAEWFAHAAAADTEENTDAESRLAEQED